LVLTRVYIKQYHYEITRYHTLRMWEKFKNTKGVISSQKSKDKTIQWQKRTNNNFQKWPSICSVCRNHKPVLFSFMKYHLVCYKSIVSGAGTTTLAEHLGAPPVFSGVRVAQSSISCAVFCKLLFVLFCHCIVLSFDFWLLITPLVFLNFVIIQYHGRL
jgi:accessory gene regulator protein AgrB